MGCNQCGECCKIASSDEYVLLCFEDVLRLSTFFNKSVYEYLSQNTKTDGTYVYLSCRYQNENKCSIYAVRPYQCMSFPYWAEILDHEFNEKDKKWYLNNCGCFQTFSPQISDKTQEKLKNLEYFKYSVPIFEILLDMQVITAEELKKYIHERSILSPMGIDYYK